MKQETLHTPSSDQRPRAVNAAIVRLSLPAVLSNIALPLLGLCDTFITGHLGAEIYLAAIAVGTVMVNTTYWLFGFLRAGTSGLTAEAFGRGDEALQRHILSLSMIIGVAIGVAIILLGWPISSLLLLFVDAPGQTATLARTYFMISTLSAPALLATMSVSGWMIGKQTTLYPMVIAISVNVINILLSLTLVYGFEIGFKGVAIGTASANWIGLGIALVLARRLQKGPLTVSWRKLREGIDLRRFFSVNSDLMLRSACILGVTFGMTAFASGIGGDTTLAVNAVLMQLFLFFSFFMDGYAYAAEALCGKWQGAGSPRMLRRCIAWLGVWGGITTAVFAGAYLWGSATITSWLTDIDKVVAEVGRMHWICAAIPVASGGAFLLDGIYIGLTRTRRMLAATFAAAVAFFTMASADIRWISADAYMWLWGAFLLFLLLRSLLLGLWLRREICGIIHK